VLREFQTIGVNCMVADVFTVGGPWNIINGIAVLINSIPITGCTGIFISKDKRKDMLWLEMLWFTIIAYVLWNVAYVYNCVSDHKTHRKVQ